MAQRTRCSFAAFCVAVCHEPRASVCHDISWMRHGRTFRIWVEALGVVCVCVLIVILPFSVVPAQPYGRDCSWPCQDGRCLANIKYTKPDWLQQASLTTCGSAPSAWRCMYSNMCIAGRARRTLNLSRISLRCLREKISRSNVSK